MLIPYMNYQRVMLVPVICTIIEVIYSHLNVQELASNFTHNEDKDKEHSHAVLLN